MMFTPRPGGLYASFRETIAILGFLGAIYSGYHFISLDYGSHPVTVSSDSNLTSVLVRQDSNTQKLSEETQKLHTTIEHLNQIELVVTQLHTAEVAWVQGDRKCAIPTMK